MQLDKTAKDVVVKIVYASEGAAALDEVAALAAQAKPGTATPIVARLGEAVRTFELRLPGLAVKGYALQLKIVGVSLDVLVAGEEKLLFAADGAVVIAEQTGKARALFDRVRELVHAADAAAPLGVVSAEPIDGIDAPLAPNGRAALQTLLKPLVAELTKKIDD